MEKKAQPQLNLERWRSVVMESLASGQSLAGYVRVHGLSRHTLYAARALMVSRGELPVVAKPLKKAVSAFVPVQLSPSLRMSA